MEPKHIEEEMEKAIELTVTEHDFYSVFNRKPSNQEEFEEFARYCEKGVHSQLDWDIIFDCVKQVPKRNDELSRCLECGKLFHQEKDIQLCDKCVGKFDLDKLWGLHDKNELDALDFNENKAMREQFRFKFFSVFDNQNNCFLHSGRNSETKEEAIEGAWSFWTEGQSDCSEEEIKNLAENKEDWLSTIGLEIRGHDEKINEEA